MAWSPLAWVVDAAAKRALTETPAFYQGEIYIQNLASQLAPLALAPQPGEMVLDLAAAPGGRDPASWAVAQMNLARLYEARVEITGRDDGRLARAGAALACAFDVFSELGLRSLTDLAAQGLQRLKQAQAA